MEVDERKLARLGSYSLACVNAGAELIKENEEDTSELPPRNHSKSDKSKVIQLCNERYLISRVRSVKLVREIGNGTQRRMDEWVF